MFIHHLCLFFCELPFYFLSSFIFWFERAAHLIKKISPFSDLGLQIFPPVCLLSLWVVGFFSFPIEKFKILIFSFVSALPYNLCV